MEQDNLDLNGVNDLEIQRLEEEIENKIKNFYIENEEIFLSQAKSIEEIEDRWKKYFDEHFVQIEGEVLNDTNIKDEDIQSECLRRAEILKEKVQSFMKKDIDIFLKEAENVQVKL